MRIAILSSWYPSDTSPLYGIFVQAQANGLAIQNDVDVLLLARGLFASTSKTESENLSVYTKKCLYLPNRNETVLKLWAHQYYLLFKKQYGIKSYDIIHCHDHYGAYAGWYINRKLGIPYVVTIHNSSIQKMTLVDWKKSYLPKVLNNAAEVIAVGQKLKAILEENFTTKIVKTVPNIIDTDIFKPIPKIRETSPFKFLFIGDLDENKGMMRLLSAFVKLDRNDTALHIIGRGPLRDQAEEFIRKNGIHNRIIIQDQRPNEELPYIYNSAHAYISLSLHETFGITILEAMSCRLPIIYTRSGGPEHIVSDHGCIETSKTDIDKIAASMTEMIDNYENIDRAKIRQHVLDNYSSTSIINQLMEIYKSHVDG